MNISFKAVLTLVLGYILVFLYGSGYRLTGLNAAKAHPNLGKDAKLFAQVNYGWGMVCLFKTAKGPRTVISLKKGFIWRAPACFIIENSSDPIATVGWARYLGNGKGGGTVFAVETVDPDIAFVEVGPEMARYRKQVRPKSPVVFSWSEPLYLDDLKPVAFSKTGQALYEYTYNPQRPGVLDDRELKWYKCWLKQGYTGVAPVLWTPWSFDFTLLQPVSPYTTSFRTQPG